MDSHNSHTRPLTWTAALLLILGAATCFHLAYSSETFGLLRLLIVAYVICLAQLSRLKTTRQSFYAGLAAGFICVAPQLTCFWRIFGPAAIVLWLILAFWIAAFTGMTHASLARFGPKWTAALVPFIWTGLEYFRSELYYLRFSWLNVGYAFSGEPILPHIFGIYGMGFLAALCASFFLLGGRFSFVGLGLFAVIVFGAGPANKPYRTASQLHIAGVQMEFPSEHEIPAALDSLLAQHTNADLLVLSEYTLDGPVPDSLRDWCRRNHRYLLVGGKDPAPNNNYYDTAFVVGPNGDIVFRQGKSVPIQFFKDGLPASKQELWNSPWGKIGICVCYDLSYTRVVDPLVKMGAQLIIVPTMDVVDWGKRQHQLHALVAPVRAAEYGLPIFRLASSGISQAVDSHGITVATALFADEGQTLSATFDLPPHGSLPADRFLAPISVGITAVLLIALCFPKRGTSRNHSVKPGNAEPPNARLSPSPLQSGDLSRSGSGETNGGEATGPRGPSEQEQASQQGRGKVVHRMQGESSYSFFPINGKPPRPITDARRDHEPRGAFASTSASWTAAGESWGHTPLCYSSPSDHGNAPRTAADALQDHEPQTGVEAVFRVSAFGLLSDFGFRPSDLAIGYGLLRNFRTGPYGT